MSRTQEDNLISLVDGYMENGGHHLNVNAISRDILIDAQKNPDKYPNLVVRISGYAITYNKLNKEQQDDIINRTIHEKI